MNNILTKCLRHGWVWKGVNKIWHQTSSNASKGISNDKRTTYTWTRWKKSILSHLKESPRASKSEHRKRPAGPGCRNLGRKRWCAAGLPAELNSPGPKSSRQLQKCHQSLLRSMIITWRNTSQVCTKNEAHIRNRKSITCILIILGIILRTLSLSLPAVPEVKPLYKVHAVFLQSPTDQSCPYCFATDMMPRLGTTHTTHGMVKKSPLHGYALVISIFSTGKPYEIVWNYTRLCEIVRTYMKWCEIIWKSLKFRYNHITAKHLVLPAPFGGHPRMCWKCGKNGSFFASWLTSCYMSARTA